MLPLYLHIGLVAGVATILAVWCGWWMSRLLLPDKLKPWGGLLSPLMGYALVLVVAYWFVRDWTGLPVVLSILLPAAGALNAFAWWRTGPPRLAERPVRPIPLALLLLVTFLAGIAPLLSYGSPAIIGANWDVENYLPVTRYLERGPVSAIATSLPNPLRDLNAAPPSIGLTLGFSIWQGSVDLLSGQEAITTFAILLAWLRALGVLAVYLLFRASLKLRREAALLGAAMTSAGALLLWVQYFNFGMQLAAWPLIGLGLLVGLAAVEDASRRGRRAWPVLLGAAVALAALPVAYYPALTLFVPLAAGLGLPLFFARRPTTGRESSTSAVAEQPGAVSAPSLRLSLRLLATAGALLAAVLILSVPAIYDYTQGFGFRYSQQLTTLGLFRFVPPTDFVGLTTFELQEESPVSVAASAGFGALVVLMLVGLAWGKGRAHWIGCAAGALLYLVWLRLEDYPYAWMKGGAYAAFPFLGLVAAGAQALLDRPLHRLLRLSGAAIALALLSMMAVAQGKTISLHMEEPGLYADELPDLLALRSQVPTGSTVRLTSDLRVQGVRAALPAYLLDHTRVIGATGTGYVPYWSNGEPGEVGDFALLVQEESPEDSGYSEQHQVWSAGGFSLYRNNGDVLRHVAVYNTIPPDQNYELPGDALTGGTAEDTAASASLELAVFTPTQVLAGGTAITLPMGLTHLSVDLTAKVPAPAFRNVGPAPVVVRWARLLSSPLKEGIASASQLGEPAMLVRTDALVSGETITTTLDVLALGAGPATVALDIWDNKRGAHFGWYGIDQPRADIARSVSLSLNLRSGQMTGAAADGLPVSIGGGLDAAAPGNYTARLNILAGEQLLASPVDVFSFTIAGDGSITGVETYEPPVIAAALVRPPVLLDIEAGADTSLVGYALSSGSAAPGEEVTLTLWWRAIARPADERSILIHLRDSRGEKRAGADGPPANGSRPTSSWEAGEVVIDTHAVSLPPDLPSGDYTIAVGMYSFPSLETVPLTSQGKPLDGNVVLLPLRVKR